MNRNLIRRLPVGAEWRENQATLRVWAPERKRVTLVLEGPSPQDATELPLDAEGNGYHSLCTPLLPPGSLYRFRLDAEDGLFPDPVSRFQPQGPHGPSQLIDPQPFPWTDAQWRGVERTGQVIYELHLGTFSREGTWKGAKKHLDELAELGVSLIEVMPIHDFAGEFGWGYDGVNLFAPSRLYGTPDDARAFVDAAHALGMGVILDVVYNHFGPDGNYLPQFSQRYFTDRYKTDWGAALNYDGPDAAPVREFIVANAVYWISEFHLDGIRLDATQNIYDASPRHVLGELSQACRQAAGARSIYIVGENEEQKIRHVRVTAAGGYGLDSLWNDDLHHSALVALTGRSEAYYSDYRGAPQEFISAAKHGYLYQGQRYEWQDQNRGTASLRGDPSRFVAYLENHDQVANSGQGLRCHQLAAPARCRAIMSYILLGPETPMLFQGQEFNSSVPFLYFADHGEELAKMVYRGRNEFLEQFPSLASTTMQARLRDPADRRTFEACKLDWSEREKNSGVLAFHRDLLRLRREDPVISNPNRPIDGAVLSAEAFLLRYFAPDGDDRLLLVNLGRDLEMYPIPEPLLAPPEGKSWSLRWSSESPEYGGQGIPPLWKKRHMFLPGNSALFLTPVIEAAHEERRPAPREGSADEPQR